MKLPVCPRFGIGAVLVLLSVAALPAHAVEVTMAVPGVVTAAHPSNPFGLAVNNTVTAVAVYDTGDIAPHPSFDDPFISIPGKGSLTITLGTFTYTDLDDTNFDLSPAFPGLFFTNPDYSRFALLDDPLVS